MPCQPSHNLLSNSEHAVIWNELLRHRMMYTYIHIAHYKRVHVPVGVQVSPQGLQVAPNLIIIGPYDTQVSPQVTQSSNPASFSNNAAMLSVLLCICQGCHVHLIKLQALLHTAQISVSLPHLQ